MASSTNRKVGFKNKHKFWKNHVETWQMTGMGKAEYCRKHGLAAHRFLYWRKKFQAPEQSQSLIEVNLSPTSEPKTISAGSSPRVIVNRFEVAVDRNFDSIALSRLIHVLEQI